MAHKKQHGLSMTEKQAMVASSTPTSTNPFATIDDIGGAALSSDINDALAGAAAPASTNVFATMADIPTVPKEVVGQVTFTGNNGIGKQNVTAVTGGLTPAVGDTIIFNLGIDKADGTFAQPLVTGTAVGALLVSNTGSPAVDFLSATDYSGNDYTAILAR